MPEINIVALVVSVVVSMIIGMLWYGPLFGKAWMQLAGITMEDTQKGWFGPMLVSVLGAVIGVMVFDIFTVKMGVSSMRGFVETAAWLWVGFVAFPTLVNTLFRGSSRKLWAIEASHVLVWMLMVAIIYGFIS